MSSFLEKVKNIQFSLFWKFAIAIVVIVIIFGSINIKFLSRSIYEINNYEITKHEEFVARTVASRVLEPFVYEDVVTLNKLIEEIKSMDSSIAYILILDNHNRILAHTFQSAVPGGLLFVNRLNGQNLSKVLIKNNKNQLITDIAVPLLGNNIGEVRVGMYERKLYKNIRQKIDALIMMIGFFLTLGIMGAFLFSYYITQPIQGIAALSKNLDLNTIKNMPDDSLRVKRKLAFFQKLLLFPDEIDLLIEKFNQMLRRLKTTSVALEKTQLSLFQNEKLASVGTLASGVAHEINTPIAGILYSIKRIKKAPDNKKQLENYLNLMEESAQRIHAIAQGLVNFSRNYNFELTRVALKEVIREAFQVIEFKLQSANIELTINYGRHEQFVLGSKNHLNQVFVNVILNGIEAVMEKQKQFPEHKGWIGLVVYSKNAAKTVVEIRDNGIGMSKEEQYQIFDPFFTTKEVGEGTGLGMSVSYNIIKAHQGEMEVHSVAGQGTSVIITLNTFKKQNE
ncbi:MAG TPA: hypothetical protein ENJ69_02480 [Bacteroidetes bacterium]|nr:hypothetical protein [Bacteroidota bacterium]